jgi:hypothetical protein
LRKQQVIQTTIFFGNAKDTSGDKPAGGGSAFLSLRSHGLENYACMGSIAA